MDDLSEWESITACDAVGEHRDLSTDSLELFLHRVASIHRVSAAEERSLWKKYHVWQHVQKIPGSRIPLTSGSPARAVRLYGCNFRCVLSRVVQGISDCHKLIVLLRHHAGLDELGDTIVEDDQDDAKVAIVLYRLMQGSQAQHRNKMRSASSCCLDDFLGFLFGQTLDNIAFGKGNATLVSKIGGATGVSTTEIEGKLHELAINRQLLPTSIVKLINPRTPLPQLPSLLGSLSDASFSEFVSEYYQPFVLGVKAEGIDAFERIVESHLWLALDIAKRYSTENVDSSLDDCEQEDGELRLLLDYPMRERGLDMTEAREDEGLGSPPDALTRTPAVGWIDVTENKELSLPLDDLAQEAIIGLMRAAESFDPRLASRYMKYATFWVYQSIHRAIADQARIIRLPAYMADTIRTLDSVVQQLAQECGRMPNADEIGMAMGVSPDKVRQIVVDIQLPLSLDSPLSEDGQASLSDVLEDETAILPFDTVSSRLLKELIDTMLDELTEREKKVLQLRFGLKDGHARTLEEVGRELDLTRERIRQLEGKVLTRLRHPMRARRLKGYVD